MHNPATAKHVRTLALNGRASKVALAEDLGIVNRPEAIAIQVLSEVRNTYAHRVENITKSLADFAETYDEAERYKFIHTMALYPKGLRASHTTSGPIKNIADKYFSASFRVLMHWGLELILNALSEQDAAADRERARREALERGDNPFLQYNLGFGSGTTKLSTLMGLLSTPAKESPAQGGA